MAELGRWPNDEEITYADRYPGIDIYYIDSAIDCVDQYGQRPPTNERAA